MSDPELEAIRAKRLAEMQGGRQGGMSKEDQEEMQRRQEDMKNNILVQVLDQSARARLNTIALTKPDKAKMIESMLIQMAQTRQIQGQLSEEGFKQILEQVTDKIKKTTTVVFDRRRAALDSDDD